MVSALGMDKVERDGRRRIDPIYHRWLCDEIMVETSSLFLLPRDHTKSVTGVVIKSVQEVLIDPNQSILLASVTLERSKRNMSEIQQHLANPVLTYLFPDILYKDPASASNRKLCIWTNEKITVKRKVVRSDPTIAIAGVGKSIAGSHPDKIFLDDILDERNVTTEDQILKIINWWEMLQPIAATTALCRIYGTIYDDKDLYCKLIDDVDKHRLKMRVVQRGAVELPDNRGYPLPGPVSKYWEGRFIYSYYSDEILREKEQGMHMTPYLFRRQYFNDTKSKTERPFDTTSIDFYRELEGPISDYEWIMTVDPSFTQSKQADYIGLVLCGYGRRTPDIWVELAIRLKCTVIELLRKMREIHEKYKCAVISVEKGAWQNALQDIWEYVTEHEGWDPLPIEELPLSNEANAKVNRIVGLVGYFDQGMIHFKYNNRDDLTGELLEDNTDVLITEMYYFSTTMTRQKIDVLDAFSMQPKVHAWGAPLWGYSGERKRHRKTYREILWPEDKQKSHDYGWY
jgi:hypothetical protein